MCCFSRPVIHVAGTRIFARKTDAKHQGLAYQMEFAADEDLAMILPIPVAEGTAENAVKFINLEKYDDFFKDLKKGFPEPPTKSRGLVDGFGPKSNAAPRLVVEKVGAFEASFVPTSADFDRLDPRFSIPRATWDKIPLYKDYGFVVFKLAKGEKEVHPMAFSFPTRHPDKLFFPTVHIHDGEVHTKENFDHDLYCQVDRFLLDSLKGWRESPQPASFFTDEKKTHGLINGGDHVYLNRMHGVFKNEDVLVGTA